MAVYIPLKVQRRVEAAAKYRCGYCLTAKLVSGAQMHIEHIIPTSKGGTSDESNLWLSCAWCNSYKGVQISASDPETGQVVPLFNPRAERWHEHFRWSEGGVVIIGLTPTGRATVIALQLNNEHIVPSRRLWAQAGWHPPVD
jgi:hypothetical protein